MKPRKPSIKTTAAKADKSSARIVRRPGIVAVRRYAIVDIEQGTSDWLEWRNNGIGASDAPAIMGENPWKKSDFLLSEKLGREKSFVNGAMKKGTALEPEARKHYERTSGNRVTPACLQSNTHEWQRASVDGLAPDGGIVVEIKCGERAYKEAETNGRVPDYYVGQLQHILAVTGLPHIDFFCWLPSRPGVCLRIQRDARYISRLIEAEHAFWRRLTEFRRRG